MADADRRYYFTADKSELVQEGDPDAASLAAAVGRPIPEGVPVRKAKQKSAPANKAAAAPEDKAAPKTRRRKTKG